MHKQGFQLALYEMEEHQRVYCPDNAFNNEASSNAQIRTSVGDYAEQEPRTRNRDYNRTEGV